jgi:hypothetical protein
MDEEKCDEEVLEYHRDEKGMISRNNGRGKCQEVKDRGGKWMISVKRMRKVRRDHKMIEVRDG